MGHTANENDARMYNEKWSRKEPNQPRVTLVMSIISATGLYCSPINSNTITAEESKPQLGRGNKTKCLGGTFLAEETVSGPRPQSGTQATSRALTSDLSMMHPKLHAEQPSKELKECGKNTLAIANISH